MKPLQNLHVLFTFGKVHNPLRLPCEAISEGPKVARDRQFLTLLTSKCASRHTGVHFFDIATSKSGPTMVCFVHFELEMCFAPQRRALSTSQLPKVLQTWCAFSRACIFFLLTLSLLWSSFIFLFSDLLSSSLLFSDSSHLCIFICTYCRKFDF